MSDARIEGMLVEDTPRDGVRMDEQQTEPRRSQESLMMSEERFRFILENTNDVIYRRDLQRDQYDYMSSAIERLTGIPVEEIKRLTVEGVLERIHPEDLPRAREVFERAMTSDQTTGVVEYRFRCGDGSYVWLSDRYTVIKDSGGVARYYVGVARDATVLKKAEGELRLSEEKYRVLIEESSDPIFSFSAEGRYTLVNKAFAEGIGRLPSDIIGKTIGDVFSKEEAEKRVAVLEQVFKTGSERVFEVRVPRPDGDQFYITTVSPIKDRAGRVLSVICSSKNITARKRAESELRLKNLVFDLSIAANSIADANGVIVEVNAAFLHLWGYQGKDEVVGKHLTCFVQYKEDVASAFEVLNAADRWEGEFLARRKDGSTFTAQGLASTVRDADGVRIGYQSACLDVTEPRRAAEAVRQSQDFLQKIIGQSPISMAIVGLDGTIEYINNKAVETFGYLPEDIPTMERWWLVAYPDEGYRAQVIATWTKHVERAITENREIARAEYRVTCKDGSVRIVSIFGVFVADKVFVMFDDITERMRAEDEIRRLNKELERRVSERTSQLRETVQGLEAEVATRMRMEDSLRILNERYELAVKSAGIGVWDWEARTGVLRWDEQAFKLYGVTPYEFNGTYADWLKAVHPDDSARCEAEVRRALAGGPYETEFRVVWPAGQVRHLQAFGRVIRSESGEPLRLLGVNFDITERKRSEEAVRQNEARLAEAQRVAHIGSWELDIQRNVLWWSDETFRMFGFEKGKFGHTVEAFFACVHPDDRQWMSEAAQAAYAGKPFDVDHRIILPCGEERVVREVAEVVFDEAGRPLRMIGTVQDITARKRAEEKITQLNEQLEQRVRERTSQLDETVRKLEGEVVERKKTEAELRESEERLRFTMAASRSGAWDMDILTHAMVRTPEHDRIYGYEELLPEWTYEMFLEHVIPDDRAMVDRVFQKAIREQCDWSFEFRIVRRDGEQRWIWACGRHRRDADGRSYRVAGIVQDITERKRMEQELRESEAMYSDLVNNQSAGIYRIRVRKHQPWGEPRAPLPYAYEFMNDRFCELTGVSREELLADPSTTMRQVHADDSAACILQNERSNRTLEPFHWIGRMIIRGETRWMQFESLPRELPNGDRIWTGVLQDITELKEYENQLRATVDFNATLVREIHHRVKNNLSSIMGLLRIHLDALGGRSPEAWTAFSEFGKHVKSMILLHKHLYRDDIGAVSMSSYLKGIADMVSEHHRRPEIAIRLELTHVRMRIEDAAPCGLVVNELLTNSFKHAFPQGGGKVVLTLRPAGGDDCWRLAVADDGVGFPQGFTVDPQGTTGMRLVSVFAQQLKARIEAGRGEAGGAALSLVFRLQPHEPGKTKVPTQAG